MRTLTSEWIAAIYSARFELPENIRAFNTLNAKAIKRDNHFLFDIEPSAEYAMFDVSGVATDQTMRMHSATQPFTERETNQE